MAISFVGSYIGTHAATTAQSIALSNLKNSAGATPTLQAGDFVLVTVFQAYTAARTQAQLLPTGYTASHAAVITASDTNIASQQTSHKFMGATPDTTISIPASAATTGGIAYSIHVFRGVDSTTPIDVTAVTATGTNGAVPNPAAITPVSAGAFIYIAGGGAMAAGATPQTAAPTGFDTTTNAWRAAVLTTTTNDPGLAAGFKSNWTSGAFDPPALTGYTTTNTGSWTAVTLAIRGDQPATITSSSTFSQSENVAFATTLTANETVTWSIVAGNDGALFSLSGSTLSLAAKDYENPTDANHDNAYVVTVRATDSGGNTTDQTITVTITNTGPTITSSGTYRATSGSQLAFSLTADETVTWSIVGGLDQSQFELSGATLQWSANGTRDSATPADSNADNVYVVTVRATDSTSETADQSISVTVAAAGSSSVVKFDSNPANTSTDFTISSNGLSVTRFRSFAGPNATAIATLGKSSSTGEGYFEVTFNAAPNQSGVGLGPAGFASDYLHDQGFAFITDGRLDLQNVALTTGFSWTDGSTIGIYLKNGKVWVILDGVWQGSGGNPNTGGAGLSLAGIASTIYPAVFTNSSSSLGTDCTLNCGDSAFMNPIPIGGSAWNAGQVVAPPPSARPWGFAYIIG